MSVITDPTAVAEQQSAPDDLSIRDAAETLGVPESFVVGLIDRGELTARTSAAGSVVSAAAVGLYKADLKRKRIAALAELQAQAQELGLGY